MLYTWGLPIGLAVGMAWVTRALITGDSVSEVLANPFHMMPAGSDPEGKADSGDWKQYLNSSPYSDSEGQGQGIEGASRNRDRGIDPVEGVGPSSGRPRVESEVAGPSQRIPFEGPSNRQPPHKDYTGFDPSLANAYTTQDKISAVVGDLVKAGGHLVDEKDVERGVESFLTEVFQQEPRPRNAQLTSILKDIKKEGARSPYFEVLYDEIKDLL